MTTASDFIDAYSKINVVDNALFSRAWPHFCNGHSTYDDSIGLYSIRGNSRDAPTPLEHHCRKTAGCNYKSLIRASIAEHERICDDRYVERATAKEKAEKKFHCTYEGCQKRFASSLERAAHIRVVHKFLARSCPQGCNPGKFYETESSYKMHMERLHSGRWPTRCRFLGCDDEKRYNDGGAYRKHLESAHGLATRDQRAQWMPPEAQGKSVKIWEPASCPVENCKNTTRYKHKYELKMHIVQTHGLSKEDANKMAGYGYVMKPATEAQKERKGAKRARKTVGDDVE